jgi:hypothetical protein
VGQAHRVESESEEPVIRVDFDRSAATASAVGMVWRSPEGAEPIYPLARLLADRGFRGPAIFYDERGMACITVRCIAAMARRYAPNEADKAAKREAKKQAGGVK